MGKKTRSLALSALFAALTVIVLYIPSIWPTGLFGLVAVSSMFGAAAVIETGIASGLSVYAVSSALGMLLLPNKAAPILFIFFFGYYPVVKSLAERIKRKILQWVVKLLVFNAAMIVLWLLFKELVFSYEYQPPLIVLFPGAVAVFILFDYGYSKVIRFYTDRVSMHIGG